MSKTIQYKIDLEKPQPLTAKQKSELKKLAEMPESEIDYSDIPPLTDEFWANAELVVPVKKKAISLRLDEDIIDFFKNQGKGYQTKINMVLRTYVKQATQ